jgi:hypothetical protein
MLACTQWSYAGLTRVSIDLQEKRFSKRMDCRVKPGNDELREFRVPDAVQRRLAVRRRAGT